ncbi:MAG: hypothetical protein ACYS8Z_15075, partial [Planctomycetota bacterium]
MDASLRGSNRSLAMAILALAAGAIVPVLADGGGKAVPGFKIGPRMDKIVPGRFFVDPPTLENLGFRWYIEGDSNRNA